MLQMSPHLFLINWSCNPFLHYPPTAPGHLLPLHPFSSFLCSIYLSSPPSLFRFSPSSCWSLSVIGHLAACTAASYGDETVRMCFHTRVHFMVQCVLGDRVVVCCSFIIIHIKDSCKWMGANTIDYSRYLVCICAYMQLSGHRRTAWWWMKVSHNTSPLITHD